MNKSILSAFIVLFLFFNKIYSQSFEILKFTDGSQLPFCTNIEKDKLGFLWISTVDGLFRYDAYDFKTFKNAIEDSTSLPFNQIQNFYIDSTNRFWLWNSDTLITFQNEKKSDFVKDIIAIARDITEDEKYYWILTNNNGLFSINKSTFEITHFCNKINDFVSKTIFDKINSFINSESALCKIEKVTINQNLKVPFKLNSKKIVLGICIAEGFESLLNVNNGNSFMGDYGFMTCGNDTIWKMIYNNTKYAGGKEKNRIEIFIDTLDVGDYELNFVSDESHAFNNWNAEKPEFVTNYGLFLYELDEQQLSEISDLIYINEKNRLYTNKIFDFLINSQNILTLMCDTGLYFYDSQNQTFKLFPVNFNCETKTSVIHTFAEISENYYLIIFDKFFFLYNSKSDQLKTIENNLIVNGFDFFNILKFGDEIRIYCAKGFYSIVDNSLKFNETKESIIAKIDIGGNNFFALFSNGKIGKYTDKKFEFSDFTYSTNTKFSSVSQTKTFFLENSGNLYFISDKFLKILNLNTSKTDSIPLPCDEDAIKDFIVDKNGNIWLSMYYDNKVIKFITSENKLIDDYKIGDFSKIKVTKFFETMDSSLLIFTDTSVYFYNIDKKLIANTLSFSEISVEKANFYHYIDFILEDSDENIWFRTSSALFCISGNKVHLILQLDGKYINKKNMGNIISDSLYIWLASDKDLYKINKSTFKTDTINFRNFERQSYNDADIRKSLIIFDENNKIWISTYDGLFCYDLNIQTIDKYYDDSGLLHNRISNMFIKNKKLWLSTLLGISVFDVEKKTFQKYNFDSVELFSSFCNTYIYNNSYFLTGKQRLVFFSPDSINTQIPEIVITKFSIYGQEYETDSLIYLKKTLNLNYFQNNIVFEFSALNYIEPQRNQYAYKLEGVDDEWIYCDYLHRSAKYTELSPGKYIFRVKGSNNDGVWNETGVSISVNIIPPWWKTKIAYVFYVILSVLSIYLIIKIRERKLIQEKDKLEKIVKIRTHEIQMQKEEIEAQNEALMQSKEEIQAQNEEIIIQKDELTKQKKDIVDSINYAAKIQNAVLPTSEILSEVLQEYFIIWKPRNIVSGDFYWTKKIKNLTVLAIADCTGHGVPGAFMSMLGISFLNEIVNRTSIDSTGMVLNNLRKKIKQTLKQYDPNVNQKDGMDIVLIFIDNESLELQFSGAYNPLYIVRKKPEDFENSQGLDNPKIETIETDTAKLFELKADRQPVAVHLIEKEFTTQKFNLLKNDIIYAGSDGYIDQLGGDSQKKFMSKNYKKLLLEIFNQPLNSQKKILETNLEKWQNSNEQVDDILVVGFKII